VQRGRRRSDIKEKPKVLFHYILVLKSAEKRDGHQKRVAHASTPKSEVCAEKGLMKVAELAASKALPSGRKNCLRHGKEASSVSQRYRRPRERHSIRLKSQGKRNRDHHDWGGFLT